jgi:hypothetical protein
VQAFSLESIHIILIEIMPCHPFFLRFAFFFFPINRAFDKLGQGNRDVRKKLGAGKTYIASPLQHHRSPNCIEKQRTFDCLAVGFGGDLFPIFWIIAQLAMQCRDAFNERHF